MKQIIKEYGMIVVMLLSFLPASAYDFEVDGIYYNVLSLSELTCEVTYNSANRTTSSLRFEGAYITESLTESYPSYTGSVCIPQKVVYKNRELTVTGIGAYAFLNCRSLTSLTLPSTITSIKQVFVQERYGERYYAGAFDYCNIQTFSAGNAYTLQQFDQSYAYSSGYKTKDNLKDLTLSHDFEGLIDVDFSIYKNLVTINSNQSSVPLFSSDSLFSNNQFLNVLVNVPTTTLNLYRQAPVWSLFWDITGDDNPQNPPSQLGSYDFEVEGIYYNVLSLSELTCEVTYNSANRTTSSLRFEGAYITESLTESYPSYTGSVCIPQKVVYKNRELTVTGIGAYAFLNCRSLTSLTLPSTITSIKQVFVQERYGERYYAGAFDYCNIQTFSAGNAYTLQMFNQSYAYSNSYKTKDNLKEVILSNDFEGVIGVDYSPYNKLESLKSLAITIPYYSEGSHFTNDQFLNMDVLVPEDAFELYQTSNVWKDFWELKAMKSVRSISLSQTSLDLEPKQQVPLYATVTPEDAYDQSVTWSSSNPSVASVNEDGIVTAITKGDAAIIASANDGSGVVSECSVHVNLLVKEIQISDTEIGLEPGNSKRLSVNLTPKDAYIQDVVWLSADESIASVDNLGNVTAQSVGITNIVVKTTDGSNLTDTCKVTVANLVKSIIVTPDNMTIKEGETSQLSTTVTPENATYKEVIWSSENSDVASVDGSGNVTAMSAGTTLIKATATDGSRVYGQCEVTITAETIEYNGICYQRNSLTTLKIVPNPETLYSGDFFVPNEAMFNGSYLAITEIGDEAFANCIDLTSIVIPNSISKIRESAFVGCDKLNFVKICDGSLVDANLDVIFPDSPITGLYIGSNKLSYNSNSRLLRSLRTMTLGGSVINLPPKDAFKSLSSFVVEEGESPVAETDDYCTGTMNLINAHTVKDPYTYIYYRLFYLVTYTHLSPILEALENSTLNYLHIGRDVQQIEVDMSKTYEKIPTTAGSRYQEFGYMDEVNYQYQELIVKSDYNRNPIESIAIDKNVVELKNAETVKLSVQCMPTNASFTEVEWSSSDELVAIVDIFGNVTKIADGEATITATTTDGSNLSALCKVTDPVAGIEEIWLPTENRDYLVYNLQGILVLKTNDSDIVKQLPVGLYIVNGRKIFVK